jgi:hypothetical protein
VHRETITDPAKVQEIEAALRNKQAASALAEVVTGEHPELGLVVLVKTGEGTVLLKDGEGLRQLGQAVMDWRSGP